MSATVKMQRPAERIIFAVILLLIITVPLIFSGKTSQIYGLIKIAAMEFLLILLTGLWVFKMNRRGDFKIIFTPAGIPLLIFSLICALSLLRAINLREGIVQLAQVLSYVALFFIVINNIDSKKEVSLIVNAAILTAFLSCIYSMYRDQGPYLFTAIRQTYISTFGHPVFFAQFLGLVAPVCLAVFLQSKNLRPKLCSGIALATLFFFLLLTKARGAWLGLICASLVVILIPAVIHKERRYGFFRFIPWKSIGIFLLCLLLLFSGLSAFAHFRVWHKEMVERFYSAFSLSHVTNVMRVEVWKNTWQMIIGSRLLGVGAGNFPVIYPAYRSVAEISITPEGRTYLSAHNDYLQVLAETGIFGLACFMFVIYSLFRMGISVLKKTGDRDLYYITLGILGAISVILVYALFNPSFQIPSTGMMFWLWAGLLGVLYRKECLPAREEAAPKPKGPLAQSSILAVTSAAAIYLAALLIRHFAADLYFTKARVYRESGRGLEAISILERSALLYPGNYEAYFLLGNYYQELERFNEAFAQYEAALELHPYQPIVFNNLGTVYFKTGQYQKSAVAFNRAVDLNPRYFGAYYNLYLAYNAMGQQEKAQECIRLIYELKPDFLGGMYMDQEQYDAAIVAYAAAIEKDPGNYGAHFNLGLTYKMKGLDDEAADEFRKAIALKPDHVGAYRNLGFLLFKSFKRYDEAIEIHRKLLALVPVDIEGHLNLGLLYTESGDYALAEQEFKKIIGLNPYYGKAHTALAALYRRQNDLDAAVRALKEALAISPESSEIKVMLNDIYKEKLMR